MIVYESPTNTIHRADARQVVTCEIDEDGRNYLGAVVRQIRGEDVRPRSPLQASLFGAA